MGNIALAIMTFFFVNGTLNNEKQYICDKKDPFFTEKNKDDFAPNNQTNFCRETVVRIYYPTIKNEETSPYYEANIDALNAIVNSELYAQSSIDQKKKYIQEISDKIKSYSLPDKEIIDENKQFPVLFFNPGAGLNVQIYENFITNLVSQGYIVVGINSLFMRL